MSRGASPVDRPLLAIEDAPYGPAVLSPGSRLEPRLGVRAGLLVGVVTVVGAALTAMNLVVPIVTGDWEIVAVAAGVAGAAALVASNVWCFRRAARHLAARSRVRRDLAADDGRRHRWLADHRDDPGLDHRWWDQRLDRARAEAATAVAATRYPAFWAVIAFVAWFASAALLVALLVAEWSATDPDIATFVLALVALTAPAGLLAGTVMVQQTRLAMQVSRVALGWERRLDRLARERFPGEDLGGASRARRLAGSPVMWAAAAGVVVLFLVFVLPLLG